MSKLMESMFRQRYYVVYESTGYGRWGHITHVSKTRAAGYNPITVSYPRTLCGRKNGHAARLYKASDIQCRECLSIWRAAAGG